MTARQLALSRGVIPLQVIIGREKRFAVFTLGATMSTTRGRNAIGPFG